jgi:hypothetical protein
MKKQIISTIAQVMVKWEITIGDNWEYNKALNIDNATNALEQLEVIVNTDVGKVLDYEVLGYTNVVPSEVFDSNNKELFDYKDHELMAITGGCNFDVVKVCAPTNDGFRWVYWLVLVDEEREMLKGALVNRYGISKDSTVMVRVK